MHLLLRLFAAILVVLFAAPAWSAGNDELWEMTVSMDMGGMTMPGRATNTCLPKGGNYKPGDEQQDKHCQVNNYKVSGNKVTWAISCTGKDAMTGSGEVTKTATTMKGVMSFSSQGMQMSQVINGKLVGTCDASAERQKMEKFAADIKQRASDTNKQLCESSMAREVESGGYGAAGATLFHGKQLCASYQPELCKKARAYAASYKGYAAYANNRASPMANSQSWGWVLGECKINLDKQLSALCKQAVTDQTWRFVGGYCPAEAQALNTRECAEFGMSRSPDMSNPKTVMCLALRGNGEQGGDPDRVDDIGGGATAGNNQPEPARDAPETKAKGDDNPAAHALDAVKKLKGMFGF